MCIRDSTWPDMTVLDNLFLGREIKNSIGFLDKASMERKAKEAFKRLNISIPLDAIIGQLSVGQQQMIEIAKCLLSEVSLLIMDEPTAALTDRETETLFKVIELSLIHIYRNREDLYHESGHF